MHGTTVIYTKLDEENLKQNELRRDFKSIFTGSQPIGGLPHILKFLIPEKEQVEYDFMSRKWFNRTFNSFYYPRSNDFYAPCYRKISDGNNP